MHIEHLSERPIAFIMLPIASYLDKLQQRLRSRQWHAAKLRTMAAIAGVSVVPSMLHG
jgi:hypothetical protein